MNTETQQTPAPRILVGRQPIFDRNLDVYAYELLFRDEQTGNLCLERDGDMATSRTILNAFMEIGLERLTNGRPPFLNLTRGFFTEMPPIPFDPDTVVLEVLEDIPVDEHLVELVRALNAQGYRIALDDYLFEDKWQPLLLLISLIKVEITEKTMQDMARRIEPLKELPIQLLAEKVETREQCRELHALGFDLFQGYFFARPDIVTQEQLSESQLVLTRLLAELNNPEADLQVIADLISHDPALSFKMLRLINSAATSLRREIDSNQQAAVLLGLERIRAWATLFAMAGSSEHPRELINIGLLRASLCERLSKMRNLGRPDTAYTVGLLSILDGILAMPMEEALKELPLPESVKQGIGQRSGDYGALLEQAIELETGRLVPQDTAEEEQLLDLFLESGEAAFGILRSLE